MKTSKLLAVLPAVTAALVVSSAMPAAAATPVAVATPASGLVNGQTVTLTGSGYPADHPIFVLECSSAGGASACDVDHLKPVTTTAAGTFSTTFTVATGVIGNGTCNPGQSCILAAGDASGVGSAAKITFKAPASTKPVTTTKTPKTTKTASTPKTTTSSSQGAGAAAPRSVSAGDGGTANRDGVPGLAILLGLSGAAALARGSVKLRRR